MSDEMFFSISGVACAKHTSETRKIWRSWPHNKSEIGRKAILEYAKELGFNHNGVEDLSTVREAFKFLISQFPAEVSGIKSFVLRNAIIKYS